MVYHITLLIIIFLFNRRISHMQSLQSTICKKIWAAIRTQLHACYHILMALKCHCNFTFVQVPYLYFIVNTACEDLIRCLRETDCCNLVFIWKCLNGPLWHKSNSLAVPSLDPLTTSAGPLREGHHEFTKLECFAIFLFSFSIFFFFFDWWVLIKIQIICYNK